MLSDIVDTVVAVEDSSSACGGGVLAGKFLRLGLTVAGEFFRWGLIMVRRRHLWGEEGGEKSPGGGLLARGVLGDLDGGVVLSYTMFLFFSGAFEAVGVWSRPLSFNASRICFNASKSVLWSSTHLSLSLSLFSSSVGIAIVFFAGSGGKTSKKLRPCCWHRGVGSFLFAAAVSGGAEIFSCCSRSSRRRPETLDSDADRRSSAFFSGAGDRASRPISRATTPGPRRPFSAASECLASSVGRRRFAPTRLSKNSRGDSRSDDRSSPSSNAGNGSGLAAGIRSSSLAREGAAGE